MSNQSTIAALDSFFQKVRLLQRSKAKQLILTADEANDLSAVLGQILADRVRTLEELVRAKEDQVFQVEINPNPPGDKK
jgi:hypothetical protein